MHETIVSAETQRASISTVVFPDDDNKRVIRSRRRRLTFSQIRFAIFLRFPWRLSTARYVFAHIHRLRYNLFKITRCICCSGTTTLIRVRRRVNAISSSVSVGSLPAGIFVFSLSFLLSVAFRARRIFRYRYFVVDRHRLCIYTYKSIRRLCYSDFGQINIQNRVKCKISKCIYLGKSKIITDCHIFLPSFRG